MIVVRRLFIRSDRDRPIVIHVIFVVYAAIYVLCLPVYMSTLSGG